MNTKKLTVAAALVLATAFGGASAAMAQSAYTTGTIAGNERAGYPSPEPYGSSTGRGLFAYAPGYGPANVVPAPGYGADGRTHELRERR
jgi:hypothetical protein